MALTSALLLLTPAARAGSWTYAVTSDRNGSTFTDNGYPQPLPPFAGPGYSITRNGSGPSGIGCSISMTVHVQASFTWVPASATDPPPLNVMVVETANASSAANVGASRGAGGTFACAADDGLGDTEADTFPDAYSKTATSASIVNQGGSLIGEHYKTYTVSGGVVTLDPHTLTATATTTYPSNSTWYYGASTSVSYSATIHATPYNFHKVPGAGHIYPDGSLEFIYDWSSTTGDKNNLTSCYWHEYVTYQGPVGTDANPNKYYPPNPPFNFVQGVSWLENPAIYPGTAQKGGSMTGTNQAQDDQLVPPLVAPSLYTYGTYTGTQLWEYDDIAKGQSDIQIPGPDSGPTSIVREFKLYDLHDYRYTVTKDTKSSFVDKPF